MRSGPRSKKQKTLVRTGGDESEEGDAWIYTAVKRDSYLFPTFSIREMDPEHMPSHDLRLQEKGKAIPGGKDRGVHRR